MKTTTTEAIVLGNRNLGENDKVIFFYSKDLGKIVVIAKGSKKISSKFTGHLETLNHLKISLYFGPRNIILTETLVKKAFTPSSENISQIFSALQIANLLKNLLMPNQQIEDLFPLLLKTMAYLNLGEKTELIEITFTIKLLDLLGYLP